MLNEQYVHQPDILSNSVLHETPTKKVRQLEMRCKELEKLLKVSASELKSRNDAFLATSVAVGYFSGQVSKCFCDVALCSCRALIICSCQPIVISTVLKSLPKCFPLRF